MADATPDRCTISMDNRTLCGDPVIPDAPVPICFAHASPLLLFLAEQFDAAVTAPHGPKIVAVMAESMGKRRAAQRITEGRDSVVYYARIGDLIKIGTTSHIARRMTHYPPGALLLATESGGYELEAQRLEEFAGSLAHGNEWFAPTPHLMAHIETLKAA